MRCESETAVIHTDGEAPELPPQLLQVRGEGLQCEEDSAARPVDRGWRTTECGGCVVSVCAASWEAKNPCVEGVAEARTLI